MKLGYKSLAVLIIVVGAVIVGSYKLGVEQASTSSSPSGSDKQQKMTAGVLPPDAQLPPNHPSFSQTNAADGARPPSSPTNSKFTHFRVGNRNVKGLYIDGNYTWIGTSGGVIRYDTSNDTYKVFDNRVDGILSNGIFHVSKLDDKIVVGTYGGGMSVFDPGKEKWKNYNIPQGVADQFVYELLKASNGDVWLATWSGVNRIRGGNLDDESKWDMFTVESTHGGLPNRWVYGVEEGKDGEMWFATEEGLARFKDDTWKNWKHVDGLGAPYELVKDEIQFTNDPGKASQHHAQLKSEQGLQNVDVAYNPNYIISLKVDKDGVVWCGTWGGGLARFDGTTWRNYTTADGLPANHIFMLYLDPQGKLWIGTSKGLAQFNKDDDSFSVMTTSDGLFADNVFSMASAPDGTKWIGSFGGVARIFKN